MKVCDRCGCESDTVRDGYEFTNCFGETVEMKLCWDCDWDVANGGDPFEGQDEIAFRRKEEDYDYDPINNDPPY